MIAGVVDEEKRPRAVDEFRDHQRTAKRRTETLLQIVGLDRGLAVQRKRRGVEHRRVEALEHRAADLIAATAAAELPAKRSAESAATSGESARPAAAAGGSVLARRTGQRAVAADAVAEALREIATAVGAEEAGVGLRRPDRRHRFRRGVGRKSRRQEHLRRRLGGTRCAVVLREAGLIREQRKTLKLPGGRLTATACAAAGSLAAAGGRRSRDRRRRRRCDRGRRGRIRGRCGRVGLRRSRRERQRQVHSRLTTRGIDRQLARQRREGGELRGERITSRAGNFHRVGAVGSRCGDVEDTAVRVGDRDDDARERDATRLDDAGDRAVRSGLRVRHGRI